METYDLTTILGVAAATTATVQIAKNALGLTGHWVLLLVVIASALWTYLATAVFGTLSGGYLYLSLSVLVSALGATANYDAVLPLLVTIAKSIGRTSIILLVVTIATGFAVGCAAVNPDRERYVTVKPVVEEYILNHPDQTQTWTNWLRSWEISIDEREKALEGKK